MRIAESAIQLYSKQTAIEQHVKHESLTLWQGGREPMAAARGGRGRHLDQEKALKNQATDRVSLSRRGAGHKRHVQRHIPQAATEIPEDQEPSADLNMRLLRAIFERLTGRKFQVVAPAEAATPSPEQSLSADAEQTAVPVAGTGGEGFGLAYDYHESHYEYEKTDFSADGVITTADGQTIDFSVSLSMSREFYSEQNINIRAGDALKDPLAINFSGTAAQLTTRDFSFDIDADGAADQISFVAPGSGFLALDANGDGSINDGSELFGTVSGDGFADLSGYDGDGNNWIDENDAIYESLRIWTKSSNGEDQLLALGKAGVGALYLGHIETLFSVKNSANALLGQVKETGLAVMESGRVVTLQQVDLVA
jgi:hypothetical protein